MTINTSTVLYTLVGIVAAALWGMWVVVELEPWRSVSSIIYRVG